MPFTHNYLVHGWHVRLGLVFCAELAGSLSVERECRNRGHRPGTSPFQAGPGPDSRRDLRGGNPGSAETRHLVSPGDSELSAPGWKMGLKRAGKLLKMTRKGLPDCAHTALTLPSHDAKLTSHRCPQRHTLPVLVGTL